MAKPINVHYTNRPLTSIIRTESINVHYTNRTLYAHYTPPKIINRPQVIEKRLCAHAYSRSFESNLILFWIG